MLRVGSGPRAAIAETTGPRSVLLALKMHVHSVCSLPASVVSTRREVKRLNKAAAQEGWQARTRRCARVKPTPPHCSAVVVHANARDRAWRPRLHETGHNIHGSGLANRGQARGPGPAIGFAGLAGVARAVPMKMGLAPFCARSAKGYLRKRRSRSTFPTAPPYPSSAGSSSTAIRTRGTHRQQLRGAQRHHAPLRADAQAGAKRVASSSASAMPPPQQPLAPHSAAPPPSTPTPAAASALR